MLFSMRKGRGGFVYIHLPLKKTLAIPKSVPLGHNMCSKINRFLTEKAAPLRQDATPFNNCFLGCGKSSFPHSSERKWPLGTNYQLKREIWLHPKRALLFESMHKCHFQISFEFFLILDQRFRKSSQK